MEFLHVVAGTDVEQRQTTNSEVLKAVREIENQEEVMKAIMEAAQPNGQDVYTETNPER